MQNWLPENYELPKSSGNYMKLEDGPNKLRVLSKPIMGFMYWNKDEKPVRLPEQPDQLPADIRYEKDSKTGELKPSKIKHFWAFVVWNYREEKLQILELTQASIQGPLQDLVINEDWGDPTQYDITITKRGQKLDTEYTVTPSPAKPAPQEAMDAYNPLRIDLNMLFKGGDPFSASVQRGPHPEDDNLDDMDAAFDLALSKDGDE